MALALAKAAALKPEIKLSQALSEFKASLSYEQKHAFECSPPDPTAVMVLTCEIDRQNAGRTNRRYGARLTSFLNSIQGFTSIVDLIVGNVGEPIAGTVWGAVKTAVQAASGFQSYFDKLSTMLMNIGLSSPRIEKYALLYPASTSLQKALCNYYTVVVNLCTKIILFVKKPAVKQMASALQNPFEDEFGTFRTELTRLGAAVKEEASIAAKQQQNLEIQESAQERKESSLHRATGVVFRKETSTALKHMQKLKEKRARTRLLDMCSTYNFETALNQARKKGSTSWIFETKEFQQWVSCDPHSTLLCTGIVGSGKSVLCANVVEELTLKKPADACLAYFFCRYDEAASLKAREVMGSLARQLIQNLPSDSLGLSQWPSDFGNIKLDIDQILSSLFPLLPLEKQYYLILDGLDECDDYETLAIAQAVQSLLRSTKHKYKVFWTCRIDLGAKFFTQLRPDFQVQFSRSKSSLEISRFIEVALTDCLESGKLQLRDPKIILTIQEALEAGAQEMFLWVAFQIESICAQISDHDILGTLKDLPRGLPETYRRILHRLQTSAVSNPRLARKIFEIVSVAQRPLTLDELGEAISIVPGETKWDISKLVNDVRKSLEYCGSFLLIDEEFSTVHFAHSSVKHHLLSKPTDNDMSDYHIDQVTAGTNLGSICVTYLNLDVLSTQLTKPSGVSQAYANSLPSNVVRSVLPSHYAVRQRALDILKGRPTAGKPNLSFETGANPLRETDKRMREVFYFLSYCKESWFYHTRRLHLLKTDHAHVYKLWNRLVEGRVTTVEFPWAPEDMRGLGEPFRAWLLQTRHISLLRKVLEDSWSSLTSPAFVTNSFLVNPRVTSLKKVLTEYVSLFGELLRLLEAEGEHLTFAACGSPRTETLMSLAARCGADRVVRLLLEMGADVNSRVQPESLGRLDLRNALHEAVSSNNRTTAEILIEHGADVNFQEEYYGSALQQSVHWSSMVNLLLEKGAEVNAIGGLAGTALKDAASMGSVEIVEALLRAGADVSIDCEGFKVNGPAFADAAVSDNSEDQITIMDMLVKTGADINCRFVAHSPGSEEKQVFGSPLVSAVEFARHDVIDFLLKAGADIMVPARNGESLLKVSAGGNGKATVPKLLKYGAEIELGPNPPTRFTERYFKKLYETDSETARMIYEEFRFRGYKGTVNSEERRSRILDEARKMSL